MGDAGGRYHFGERREREGTSRYEPELTTGVPEEEPLPAIRTDGLTPLEVATVTVYRQKIRGVVNVTAPSAFRTRLEQEFPVAGTGSGSIVDPSGHVVTNYLVVKGAQSLIVTMQDGSTERAHAIGRDIELSLAVLRFDPQGRRLTALPFGDGDRLQVGQRVLALGNPYGHSDTLSSAIVSGPWHPAAQRCRSYFRGARKAETPGMTRGSRNRVDNAAAAQ